MALGRSVRTDKGVLAEEMNILLMPLLVDLAGPQANVYWGGQPDLFSAEHRRATFHERLDAFFHVFAAENTILDLWDVIDRSFFT